MVKTLTTDCAAQKNAQQNYPKLLVQIDWSDTVTGYYAAVAETVGGNPYLGVLADISDIMLNLAPDAAPIIDNCSLIFINTDDFRFSDYIHSYGIERKEVRIYQFFDGLVAADMELIFRGIVWTEPNGIDIGDELITIPVQGILKKFDTLLGDIITETDFPNAPKESIGQIMPIVIGDLSDEDVPAIPVATGGLTQLSEGHTDSVTTITVKDASTFPSSGTIIVGEEEITYTGTTATTFTGCTRGANSTRELPYSAGTHVYEVLSGTNPWIYLIAGHEVKQVTGGKINGVSSASAVYETANTTLVSGKTLALVRFPSRPLDESGDSVTATIRPSSVEDAETGDGDSETYYDLADYDETTKQYFEDTYLGKILAQDWYVEYDPYDDIGNKADFEQWDGSSWNPIGEMGGTAGTRKTKKFPHESAARLKWKCMRVAQHNDAGPHWQYYIYEVWLELTYIPHTSIDYDPTITANVQGLKDDGSSTITGTPDALLEYSPHIIRKLLVDYCGAATADINTTDFATAVTALTSAAMKNAGRVDMPIQSLHLIQQLAFESECYLWAKADNVTMLMKSSSLGASQRHITDMGDVLPDPLIRRGSPAQVENTLQAEYGKLWYLSSSDDDAIQMTDEITDATSITDYGERRKIFTFDFLRTQARAEAILTQRKAVKKDVHYVAEVETPIKNFDLERADVLELSIPKLRAVKAKGEIQQIRLIPGNAKEERTDIVELQLWLEAFDPDWMSATTGAFARLADSSWYFVIDNEIVARLASDGTFYIKGFIIQDQTLAAASDNPITWDVTTERIDFALNDDTCVMEIDKSGNLRLPVDAVEDQGTLGAGGTADSIESDASKVWFNIGSVRAAEVTAAGALYLPKNVVEDANWQDLYD